MAIDNTKIAVMLCSKTVLWIIKFEFYIIATCHTIYYSFDVFFQTLVNVISVVCSLFPKGSLSAGIAKKRSSDQSFPISAIAKTPCP